MKGGVIVLEDGATLPEGTAVIVSREIGSTSVRENRKPVEFPLVHSKHPGTLQLTSERIAELLEDEDVSPRH